MRFLAALAFLTVIPVPRGPKVSPTEVGQTAGFFPLVGALLGLILVGLDGLLRLALPPSLVNIGLLIALMLLTGLLHLDGLIDTCDGVGASRSPKEAWAVMSDSRVGSFGVAGAFCLLLLKYVSLGNLPDGHRVAGLLLMPALSRWAVVWPIFFFPCAKAQGLGRAFKQYTGRQALILATVITLLLSLTLLRATGIALMFGAWSAAMGLAAFLNRRFAGLTGDTYGAIIEATEVIALILVSSLPERGW